MLLKYLPANQSWAFLFGDSIVQIGNEKRLFVRLSDALKVANQHGLTVQGARVIARAS